MSLNPDGTPEFAPWPSIPRLFRDVTVTEKIDGTNAAVVIKPFMPGDVYRTDDVALVRLGDVKYVVWAQSRSRTIAPGPTDNHSFASWVWNWADDLVVKLGEGRHFGEWWGSGVNRGYGLVKGEKRFSLFNTKRWTPEDFDDNLVPGLGVVPVLFQGPMGDLFDPTCRCADQGPNLNDICEKLEKEGSVASPGFMRPEGVVIYHHAANHCFKYTPFDNDGHKSQKD